LLLPPHAEMAIASAVAITDATANDRSR